MNSNVIKIGALGVGAYFLWPHLQRLISASATAPTPSPSTNTPATSTVPAVSAPTHTVNPDAGAPPAVGAEATNGTDTHLKKAAAWKGWASQGGNVKLNWHQWNYYRRAWNPSLTAPSPESVGLGDGMATMTAADYHATLASFQLAGIVLGALRHAR